ncbi:FecR family protein [Massilia sp. W12]|uniref:FecR family protein n=1 Tax=Massilia sp. W12 TaxID=3126507 RepID=UPI0030CB97F4
MRLSAVLCGLWLAGIGQALAAQVVGTVLNVSGPLLAQKVDGSVKILTNRSEVEQGDTLISEKNTYARIKFVDNSEVTLKPNSQFRVNNFVYDETRPQEDSAVLSLIKGGLRSITGLLGKRNKERYSLNTPTATIGIRGTTFIADYVAPEDVQQDPALAAWQAASVAWLSPADRAALGVSGSAYDNYGGPGVQPLAVQYQIASLDWQGPVPERTPLQLAQINPGNGGSGLSPGLYVHVIDGLIQLSNRGGVQQFAAGQFGFSGSVVQAPVIVPQNPGIQFNPPPGFNASTAPGARNTEQKKDVNCEVR